MIQLGVTMILEFIFDIDKLLLIIYCIRVGIKTYVQLQQPPWSTALAKPRLAVLLILVLSVLTVNLNEDVIEEESWIIDKLILLLVHQHSPQNWQTFFEFATYTGSSTFLLVFTMASTIVLLLARRRLDALLLSVSTLKAAALVYKIKLAINRARTTFGKQNGIGAPVFPVVTP